mmetsp:Transcript_69203/g.200801  ORF Transcript_69203/g.200801 Transcript_69203/m.200801 type:complete len:286 (+) Transcript_69203:1445-2302(+)
MHQDAFAAGALSLRQVGRQSEEALGIAVIRPTAQPQSSRAVRSVPPVQLLRRPEVCGAIDNASVLRGGQPIQKDVLLVEGIAIAPDHVRCSCEASVATHRRLERLRLLPRPRNLHELPTRLQQRAIQSPIVACFAALVGEQLIAVGPLHLSEGEVPPRTFIVHPTDVTMVSETADVIGCVARQVHHLELQLVDGISHEGIVATGGFLACLLASHGSIVSPREPVLVQQEVREGLAITSDTGCRLIQHIPLPSVPWRPIRVVPAERSVEVTIQEAIRGEPTVRLQT